MAYCRADIESYGRLLASKVRCVSVAWRFVAHHSRIVKRA